MRRCHHVVIAVVYFEGTIGGDAVNLLHVSKSNEDRGISVGKAFCLKIPPEIRRRAGVKGEEVG